MNFGERMKSARIAAQMTQQQLADAVGVSLRTITNYEIQGRYPKQHAIYQKLADVLHVDINYLLAEGNVFTTPLPQGEDSNSREKFNAVLSQAQALFSGGEFSDEDKDELMRAIQDAYWVARKKK